MVTAWRLLWREPRAADAPAVGRLDRLMAGVLACAVVLEGALRPDVAWRPLVVVLGLALVPAVLWRRQHPLVAVLVGWGVAALLSILQLAVGVDDLGLTSMMVVLVLLFALVRWGSGREIVAGASYVAAVVALGLAASSSGWTEVFGASAFVLLVGALAAVFRYRADVWRRQRDEVRGQERVALARELHDVVAHHVSAIAVQAQAGGAIAGTRPDKAAEILAAIEAEASRTLAEMRSMVRVLREDDAVDYAPLRGVADLSGLARLDERPVVEVTLDGAVTRLAPHLDTAVYRLAQESLTNALRHARGATRVAVVVRREADAVRLLVSDDGRSEAASSREPGFGLLGMTERAQLLGGSLAAGPVPGGGWVVEAVLPLETPA